MPTMKRRRAQPEAQLQAAVCQHLERRAIPGLVWFHVPNSGKREPRSAAILKRLGVKAGVSDLIFVKPIEGVAYALELKAPKGKPTEAQNEFLRAVANAGGHAAVASSLDVALRLLAMWGLIR